MALVVEDGTGVEGATSYVSLEYARAYASARGLSLPSDDAECEALLVKATDQVETFRGRFKGSRKFGQGYLSWPRDDVTLDDEDVTGVPVELKKAQAQAAVDLQTVDPSAASTGPAVRQRTVGPLTTVYAVSDGSGTPRARMPKVDALLAPLLKPTGFTTERA